MAIDIAKEKQEAIEAGNLTLRSLRAALRDLDSAKNWGIVDMLGGGSIVSLVKRNKMEAAKKDMERAKADLRIFRQELSEVGPDLQLDLKTGDFLTFADWFFDNFFVDWMVQSRIKDARRQVEDAIRQVEAIMAQLQAL